jgi:hypothetical protein
MPLLVLGCMKPSPATLYPIELLPMDGPEPFEWDAAEDECTSVMPFLPDEPAPLVEEGEPVCRGMVLPESEYALLLNQDALASYWAKRAAICQEGRERDRAHGQAMYDATWEAWQGAEQEAMGLRVGGSAAFIVGVVIGAGIGVGAARLAGGI